MEPNSQPSDVSNGQAEPAASLPQNEGAAELAFNEDTFEQPTSTVTPANESGAPDASLAPTTTSSLPSDEGVVGSTNTADVHPIVTGASPVKKTHITTWIILGVVVALGIGTGVFVYVLSQ